MTLQLPHQWLDDEKVRQNFEKIALEWPAAWSVWTTYTATVSSTSVTLGTGGENVARYQKNGRTVHVHGRILLGTGGAFTGTDIEIALPFAAAAYGQVGSAVADEVGTGAVVGSCVVAASASTMKFRFEGNTRLGASSPFVWADTHVLTWNLTYEAAA